MPRAIRPDLKLRRFDRSAKNREQHAEEDDGENEPAFLQANLTLGLGRNTGCGAHVPAKASEAHQAKQLNLSHCNESVLTSARANCRRTGASVDWFMENRPALLLCPPDFYGVEYVINPWMEGNVHRANHELAIQQWRAFADVLQRNARVELALPQPHLPDMVFTANAGVVLGGNVVLSRFFHRERRGEEPHFRAWL